MRCWGLFFLFLLTTVISAQNLHKTELKRALNDSKKPFLLATGKVDESLVIRRIARDSVIIKNDPSAFRNPKSAYFEISDFWKWPRSKTDKKTKKFYIVSDQSLGNIPGVTEIYFDAKKRLSLVEASARIVEKKILPLTDVTFIQAAERAPKIESQLRQHNLGINGIQSARRFLSDSNPARNISVKEGSFDTLDLDISGRSERDALSSPQVTSHATDMATLIAGAGNSSYEGLGVSDQINLFSEDFADLMPAETSAFEQRAITIQNHSYGVGIENFYGIESVAFDQQSLDHPSLLHVFSSGNSGELNSTGDYADIVQYRTITGSFKQAKNVLVVTGTDEFGEVPDGHSAGPAYDGRLKPELAAYGGGGTSDAAALASGIAASISSSLEQATGMAPSGDLLKAVLIASALDIGPKGPDFKSGFGQLNMRRAQRLVNELQFMDDGFLDLTNLSKSVQIPVPENVKNLRVALVWNDPPANNGDFMALVNDLNLKLSGDGQEWLPLVLDYRPDVSLLEMPAVQKIDTLNNAELVVIESPTPGDYTLEVSAQGLVSSEQSYSVAYFFEFEDSLIWDFPTAADPQLSSESSRSYFTHSFAESGVLEIDFLENNWTQIGTIDPDDFVHEFTATNLPTEAVLRATFGMHEFKSDTFSIHPKMEMDVALVCGEELILSWNGIKENQTYELLAFDGLKMQPILSTTDTFAIIDRSEQASLFFTVRPTFTYSKGKPDETVNITRQGVGCYLNNFLVSLQDENIELNVELSLPSRISTMRILKTDRNGSATISDLNPSEFSYTIIDSNLTPGKTSYGVQLVTSEGLEISSDTISVFTTDDEKYILFPNPVTDGQLAFLSPVTGAIFQILNSSGKPLTDFIISAEFEVFPIDLPIGMYFYRVIKDGEIVKSGRFAIGS